MTDYQTYGPLDGVPVDSSSDTVTSSSKDAPEYGPLDGEPLTPETKEPAPKRNLGNIINDVGVATIKSAIGLPQAIVGLADLATDGKAGKALEDHGIDFNHYADVADSWYSKPQQQANAAVRNAKGDYDENDSKAERVIKDAKATAKAISGNPSTILTNTGESVGQMLGGAGIARKALTVIPKLSPIVAAALGEGTMAAGSNAEQVRSQTPDKLLTPAQRNSQLAAGGITGILSLAGGKITNRLGIGDVDTLLANRGLMPPTSAAQKGFVRQLVESGISESVFEELPQSAQEQIGKGVRDN